MKLKDSEDWEYGLGEIHNKHVKRIEWPGSAKVTMPFIEDEFEFISGDRETFSIQLNNEEQYAILNSAFIGEDREPNGDKFSEIKIEDEDIVYVLYGVGLHYFSQNMMGTFVCFRFDHFTTIVK